MKEVKSVFLIFQNVSFIGIAKRVGGSDQHARRWIKFLFISLKAKIRSTQKDKREIPMNYQPREIKLGRCPTAS
jgi:hypothetical protein